MKRTSFAGSDCPIARTVDLVGDWWTPLVLREVFLGQRRFDDVQRALGIGRNVLTERLRRLVDEGVLARTRYQDRPPRFEYGLTAKGQALLPVLAAMIEWGDAWLGGEAGSSLVLRHRTCGKRMRVSVVCGECGRPLEADDVQVERVRPVPSRRERGDRRAGRRGLARTARRRSA